MGEGSIMGSIMGEGSIMSSFSGEASMLAWPSGKGPSFSGEGFSWAHPRGLRIPERQ